MASCSQYKMDSMIGPLFLVASEKGLQKVLWKPQPNAISVESLSEDIPGVEFLQQAKVQITEFLNAERQVFSVKLHIQGTDFQKSVWSELLKIPYGETRSYKEVSAQLEKNAVRAVGTANGRNPLMLIIPCHRVIASNGTLAGYAGGLEVKKHLLDLEALGRI